MYGGPSVLSNSKAQIALDNLTGRAKILSFN